ALVLEEPGGRALVARDLTARLDRLAAFGDGDVAFAVQTALYGTNVWITGQPVGRGAYALRLRAERLDAAAFLEDFPQALAAAGARLAEGRADVDATLVFAGSRVLASGQVRIERLVARFAEPRSAPLTAAALVLAVDRWGLGSGGRLTLDGALSRNFRRAEGAVRAIGVTLAGCGLEDMSVPLPVEASPGAVLAALASSCPTGGPEMAPRPPDVRGAPGNPGRPSEPGRS